MELLKGSVLLLLVLAFFSGFSLKAPKGMKAMGALAGAATASFLVEAFQLYVGGDLLGIKFLGEVGSSAGSMGGVAAAILVPLALGVSPVYAVMLGVVCGGMGIIPGFITGYVMSFIIPKLEEKIPDGLDLIVIICLAAPLGRGIAQFTSPGVTFALKTIGDIIIAAQSASPYVMSFILGGVITVVATAPISSMALTAMLGLTGLPMAIGALSVMASSFMNFVFFDRMKFGDRSTTIAVAIEPLTQADIISANPIPVFTTNFIGGGIAGMIVNYFGLINNATGTATPIAGFAVMFGFNPAKEVLITAGLCAAAGILTGYVGSIVFKNYKIKTVSEIRG
ncbi:PTS sugar transporter subunit IIC [Cetobacterium sp.]|uniref:PTS sugar transporter subunit IIC n=1 Tax=Cetobacterium sp. TaxID=2071632 RepID=UPI0025F2A9EF|nr:PTS sugar transporter subunit IIC [uncultured Cetobacterium sp.]